MGDRQPFDEVPHPLSNFVAGFTSAGANLRVPGIKFVEQRAIALGDFLPGQPGPAPDGEFSQLGRGMWGEPETLANRGGGLPGAE